jgi:hypothetical protein
MLDNFILRMEGIWTQWGQTQTQKQQGWEVLGRYPDNELVNGGLAVGALFWKVVVWMEEEEGEGEEEEGEGMFENTVACPYQSQGH